MKSSSVTIQMKATEQYFRVVLFIILYEVVLTFQSVDKIRKWEHVNESNWAEISSDIDYNVVGGGSNSESVDEILKCDHLI